MCNKFRRIGKPLKLSLAVAATTLSSGQVFAQDSLFVEEVLVTARKQTESLQDVPLSLNAISTDTIDQLGISTTEDVIKLSPGLTFTKGIGGQDVRPDIRGITALSGRSNVAILVDGVDMTTDSLTGTGAGQLVSLGLYDLERVEVVRGPQSALFGRNAFGGAINYVTKKPSQKFEGSVELEAAEWGTYKGKVGVTGPITDKILYRLNLAHSETEGQYDHPNTGADLGQDDTDSASLSVQFLPTDDLEILTRVDWADQELSESAVATVPYNSCQVTTGQIQVGRARVGGTTEVVPGACDFNPNVPGPGITVGSDIPVFRGTVPEVGEENITLSDEGVPGSTNELLQLTALVNWHIGDYTFTSNTSFTDAESSDVYDLDYQQTITSMVPYSQGETVFGWVDQSNPLNYVHDTEFQRDVIFQDFRFAFEGEEVRWLAGFEYYSEEYDQKTYTRANGAVNRDPATWSKPFVGGRFGWIDATGALDPEFGGGVLPVNGQLPANESRETESFGFYASIDWAFHEQWELSIAARYQEESVEIEYDTIDATYIVPAFDDQTADKTYLARPSFGAPCPPGSVGSPSGQLCSITEIVEDRTVEGEETFYAFNPRFVLTHYFNDDVMFFGSMAQGTKPGGFNFDSQLDHGNVSYGQERLTAYELGWKTSWMNGRVIFNGAWFLNVNKDKQASDIQPFNPDTFTPPVVFVNNIGETESTGVEINTTGVVNEYVSLSLNYSYTDTEIKEFDRSTGVDVTGNALPRTPRHSLLLTMDNNWALDNFDLYMRTDVKYTSEYEGDVEATFKLDQKTIVDWRAGLIADNYEVSVYVNNVFNDDTVSSALQFVDFQQQFQDLIIAYPADKRTAGLKFKYNF